MSEIPMMSYGKTNKTNIRKTFNSACETKLTQKKTTIIINCVRATNTIQWESAAAAS